MRRLKIWLKNHGLRRSSVPLVRLRKLSAKWFLTSYITGRQRRLIVDSWDPVRYGSIFLALEQVSNARIPGDIAECGVYRGSLSRFIHATLPDRRMYLFDTFEGFDQRDAAAGSDSRFRDTSVEGVLGRIGDTTNIEIRKGLFPATARGLEGCTFALVVIDFDKYEPTLEALRFFYPRMSPSGFVFVHDYNSPESDWACSRALNEFLADRPETPISIPDGWGSAVFRKIRHA